jgi:2-iminobutanoate/2-iminopropanoate deaminase
MNKRIATAGAPTALGPYSQGIDAGELVFCSGQLGIDPATGQLADGLTAQAERALRNIGAVLEAGGCTFADVVKTTVFLTDIGDFAALNTVYAGFFGDTPPARSTFAVAALPKGARVEIEAVAHRGHGVRG